MTLRECELKLLTYSPYDIVKCGLDSFSPYSYIELPKELQDHVDNLSDDERELFEDFADDYCQRLPMMGVKNAIEFMKNDVD